MLRTAGQIVLALFASAASPAPGTPPENPQYEPETVPVPSVGIDGTSDGAATLALSGGLLLHLSKRWDITPRLTFEAKSGEGVGTLFSWTDAKKDETPPPWSLGASVVLTQRTDRLSDEAIDDVKRDAYWTCRAICSASPIPSGCGSFTEKRTSELGAGRAIWSHSAARDMEPEGFCADQQKNAASIQAKEKARELTTEQAELARANLLRECLKDCDSPTSTNLYCDDARARGYPMEAEARPFVDGDFCPDGQRVLKKHRKLPASEDLVTTNPPLTIKLGGRIGRAQFETLWPDVAGPAGQLVPRTVVRTPVTAGASFGRIVGGGRRSSTLEGLLVYDRSFQAPGATARWCVAAGTVSGSGAPAESCRELPLGAPGEKGTFRLAAYGGYLDQVANSWRVAGGIDALLHRGGGSEVSVALPLWFSFAGTNGKYLGVARFTPSFTWSTDADGKESQQARLSVTLLGQPTLFSPEFDRL